MTEKEKLLVFIENLTAEEADKIINHLPEVTALLAESSRPSPLVHS